MALTKAQAQALRLLPHTINPGMEFPRPMTEDEYHEKVFKPGGFHRVWRAHVNSGAISPTHALSVQEKWCKSYIIWDKKPAGNGEGYQAGGSRVNHPFDQTLFLNEADAWAWGYMKLRDNAAQELACAWEGWQKAKGAA